MKTYIPTIEELLRIEVPELNAIFRKASEIAADSTRPASERNAAMRTVAVVRRCLTRPPQP